MTKNAGRARFDTSEALLNDRVRYERSSTQRPVVTERSRSAVGWVGEAVSKPDVIKGPARDRPATEWIPAFAGMTRILSGDYITHSV